MKIKTDPIKASGHWADASHSWVELGVTARAIGSGVKFVVTRIVVTPNGSRMVHMQMKEAPGLTTSFWETHLLNGWEKIHTVY